jgi:C4-dicarboxylate-specific signal transduction histidine kinase
LQKELPPVVGDRVDLQRVLIKLLSSGMDAMDDVWDRPRDLWGIHLISGRMYSVSVRDCAAGLDVEKSAKIFEVFCTTKANGMAMGLPISRFIIQAHGGRIWASCAEPFGAITRGQCIDQ